MKRIALAVALCSALATPVFAEEINLSVLLVFT